MEKDTPKHGGCWLCKTVQVETLRSIPAPPTVAAQAKGLYSIAVCEDCAKKHGR